MVIKSLIRMIKPAAITSQLDLKEIFCDPKKGEFIETFRTAAAGVAYMNPDGSNRQDVLEKMKAGQKVRMLWDAGSTKGRRTVYLVRGSFAGQPSMADCFGLLSDKVAGDVVRWVTQEDIMTAAKVAKITGGTRKQLKLGCVLELSTYQYRA